MSRFSHLEFGSKQPSGGVSGTGEPIREAAFFFERGNGAWLAGNYEDALTNYSRTLEKDGAFYEGWFGQVRMLIELGEYPEAKLWADKALELFPEHPELLAAKAVACVRDAEFDKAMMFSDNAVHKKGATWYVWLARAEVLLNRGSRTAEQCISNGIGSAKADASIARLEAGRLLLRFGQYSSALGYLREAFSELPKSAMVWYELGRCQAELGMPEASRTLEHCLKLRPGWSLPRQTLNQFCNRGLFGKFRAVFRRLRRK